MSRFCYTVATLLLAGVASLAPAAAQTAGGYLLPVGGTNLTVNTGLGGWSFRIAGCGFKLNGVNQYLADGVTPDCTGVEVIPTVSDHTLSLVFESASGGNLAVSTGLKLSDLGFALTVTGPAGMPIYLGTANETGSVTSGVPLTAVSVSQSAVTMAGVTQPGPLSNLSVSPTLQSYLFKAPGNVLVAGPDFRAQGSLAGDTVTLATATLSYTVPEPVSSSLLSVGVAGLGLARHRRRRPA